MNTEEKQESPATQTAVPGASELGTDRLSQITAECASIIEQAQKRHSYLRDLVLEQAETLDEEKKQLVIDSMEGYGTECFCETVKDDFMCELDALVGGFVQRSLVRYAKRGALHDALLLLGDDARRKIKAKLLVEHEDSIFRVLDGEFLSFMDISLLDDRAIQKVLREVDQQELAMVLKGADYDVKDMIFRNMSKRAAAMLKEDIEYMGPVRRKDVYEAQDKITAIMHRLAADGEIVIIPSRDSDGELVY